MDEEKITDPDWRMMVPLFLFVIAMFVIGIHSEPFGEFFTKVAQGII